MKLIFIFFAHTFKVEVAQVPRPTSSSIADHSPYLRIGGTIIYRLDLPRLKNWIEFKPGNSRQIF